tara:strand:- start:669 stop:2144 length:1476 start_codon:yes stop_codon:yes gene_type:complete
MVKSYKQLNEGLLSGAFNLATAYFFVKKMATPFEKTEAYKLGIIDKKGRILKKMKELVSEKERKAYTLLDRVIWNIKKLMSFIPGGGSMLAGVAAATALLMKEEMDYAVSDNLVQVMLEAAKNPNTDEDMIQKISDIWEKAKGNVKKFKMDMKRARLDDRVLNKAGLQDFVDELIGGGISEIEPVEQEEGAPTNNAGSGQIKGFTEPFRRKKMKSESVDTAMLELFEREEWTQTTVDSALTFCEAIGLDIESLDEEEFVTVVNALDDFQRQQISEALWMSEAQLVTEAEVEEIEKENEEQVELDESPIENKIDKLLKKLKAPGEVMGSKGDDVIIDHPKYGKVFYNPKSDNFSFDSKKAKPLMRVWKKHTGENWKDAVLGIRVLGGTMETMIKLMREGIEETGTPIFKVSPEVYDQCKWGREKYQRWNKVVGESNGVEQIKEYGKKNPSAPIIVQNKQSGEMQYLRFGNISSELKERYYVECETENKSSNL